VPPFVLRIFTSLATLVYSAWAVMQHGWPDYYIFSGFDKTLECDRHTRLTDEQTQCTYRTSMVPYGKSSQKSIVKFLGNCDNGTKESSLNQPINLNVHTYSTFKQSSKRHLL